MGVDPPERFQLFHHPVRQPGHIGFLHEYPDVFRGAVHRNIPTLVVVMEHAIVAIPDRLRRELDVAPHAGAAGCAPANPFRNVIIANYSNKCH